MRKIIWLIIGAGLLLLAMVSVRTLSTKPIQPGPTPENFRRLYVGMEKEEVEKILGKPDKIVRFGSKDIIAHWKAKDCLIVIAFESDRWIFRGECDFYDGQGRATMKSLSWHLGL